MILPAGSSVSVYSFNTLLTGVSLTNTVSRKYYEVDVVNGVNFVMSAYNVAGGLDVAVNVHTLNGSLTEVNARGSNNYERAGIDVTKSQKSWIEVRKNGASEGTFTFLAINKNITSSSSIAEGGGSCTGGTNAAIVNRCIDFDSNYTGKPASTADCVTLWGTGSVYAASCSTTNRIARCHANPASNNGRLTINYYSTSDTTTSANTACNGDILTTP